MDYTQANEKLQGRNQYSRKVGNNTYLHRINPVHVEYDGTKSIAVRLHDTDVVTFYPNGDVKLNTGGWKTVTTKARINEFAPNGWGISQKNYSWFLVGPDGFKTVYEDGVVITADNKVKL